MRKSRRPIRIAARPSRLARAQAQMVGSALSRLHPGVAVEYVWIESEGDQRADESLANVGGKGLFTKAVERALHDGRADVAVHSLKDLPGDSGAGLTLAAVPRRADARDCLITHRAGVTSIESLPRDATVGTSSPRRAAQLRRLRPDLRVELLRGNVETRLNRILEEKRFDATLMAVAGLIRSDLRQHASNAIDPSVLLPAACQGALAVQCRSDDHVSVTRCLPLNDAASSTAVHAERAIVAGLHGDCHSPIAAYVEPVTLPGDKSPRGFRVRVAVFNHDGRECLEVDQVTPGKLLGKFVKAAVRDLQSRGADALLHGR